MWLADSLAYPHGIDRYLELVSPVWSAREVRAKIENVRHQTRDSVTLTLAPNRNWRGFRPGQYVEVGVDVHGVRLTRCYSPAGSACERRIELTIRCQNQVSRFLNERARRGMTVTLSQAKGDFTLPDPRPDRLLLISGGSGITPVMSMIRTLTAEGFNGRITFLHYARRPADVIYAAELAGSPHEVKQVFTETQGRFRTAHLPPDYGSARTYVCGPPTLREDVEAHWNAEGIGDRLKTEEFSAQPYKIQSSGGNVSFGTVTVPDDGRTLLEQAESAGLSPAYGCRMGICFTCATRKVSGSVRDVRTGAVSAEENEEIQLCSTAPCGDVVIDI